MKVISIVNIKGGVGKTVTTVNLAACFGGIGKKVLVVDIDPQSNATQYLNRYDIKGQELSTYDVLIEKSLDVNSAIANTGIANVDIIPGNIKLAACENEIINNTMRSRETRLIKALRNIEKDYDYILIDCPPSLSIFTTNALVASDYVLVPIKIDQFAIDGLGYLIDKIYDIKDEFNPVLEFLGAFITMDKRTAVNREIKKDLKEILKDKLLKTTIRENVKLVQSTFEQKPVITFAKNAASSKDYKILSQEVIEHVETKSLA